MDISDFALAKDGEKGWLSGLHKRYTKAVGEYKGIENDFTQMTLQMMI